MAIELNAPTIITTAIIGIMLVLAFRGYNAPNRTTWASYLISLGIFGTFLGITLALLNFDATAVEESVPNLIDGMQIAFVSSAVGIFLALILRWHGLNVADRVEETGKTADDIHTVLREQSALLQDLRTALVGDGDTTLITQLKLLRSETKDSAKHLTERLDHFAETLAENNSKAFIEALEGAVREFNEKISEQFGENFAQLNTAVGRLLEWQQEYRVQLTEMMQAFRDVETRLQDITSSVGQVAQQTKSLSEVSEQQARWLEAQLRAQAELEARLEAFSELSKQAQESFPTIKENLDRLMTGLEGGVKQTLTLIDSATKSLEQGVAESQAQVSKSTEQVAARLQSSAEEFQKQILETNARNQKRLEDSVEELDRALGEELSKSLQSLGNQLATLSNRFVADYTPLTERLQAVVEMSRRPNA